jgi:hypothetical protein
MREVSNKWVKVHIIESVFEMDIVKDALETKGLTYAIKRTKTPPVTVFRSSREDARHSSLKNGTERKSRRL